MVLKTVWLIPCCWQIRASAGGMIQNLVVWMVQHVPKSLWSPQCLRPVTNQYINWLGVFVHVYTLLFTKFARAEASFSIIPMHTTWLQRFTWLLIIQNRNLELQCQWGQWKALWIIVIANLKAWMYIGNETGQFSHNGTISKLVEQSRKAQEFLTQMVKFICGNWVRLLLNTGELEKLVNILRFSEVTLGWWVISSLLLLTLVHQVSSHGWQNRTCEICAVSLLSFSYSPVHETCLIIIITTWYSIQVVSDCTGVLSTTDHPEIFGSKS